MLEIKNVKKIQIRRSRFGYESESEYYSSCKNHESESEYSGFGGKDSNPNPNPNIRYNTEVDTFHVFHFIFTGYHFKISLFFKLGAAKSKCNELMNGKSRYVFDRNIFLHQIDIILETLFIT